MVNSGSESFLHFGVGVSQTRLTSRNLVYYLYTTQFSICTQFDRQFSERAHIQSVCAESHL